MRQFILTILIFSCLISTGQTPLHLLAMKQPVSVPPGPFRPTDEAGLKLFVCADSISGSDGDLIDTWTDYSAATNTLTTSSTKRPVLKTSILNSKKVLRFDNTNDNMSKSSPSGLGGLTGMTIYLVYRQASLSVSKAMIGIWDYATQGGWSLNTADASSSNFQMFIASPTGAPAGDPLLDPGGNHISTTDAAASSSDFAVLKIVYDGSNGTNANRVRFYKNGVLLTNAVSGTINTTLSGSTAPLYINDFGGALLGLRCAGGDYAAAIIYDHVAGSTLDTNIYTFINNAYAIF